MHLSGSEEITMAVKELLNEGQTGCGAARTKPNFIRGVALPPSGRKRRGLDMKWCCLSTIGLTAFPAQAQFSGFTGYAGAGVSFPVQDIGSRLDIA
jgi:hypothetical protein